MANHKPWVLITGAAGGIGQALVGEFVDSGYQVIAVDVNWEKSGFNSEDIYHLRLNLADLVNQNDALRTLLQEVEKITSGLGLNALVNNAAVQVLGATEDLLPDMWKLTWDVNLHAPFALIQGFLTSLANNVGSVVNISSIHATQTKKHFVAYATSKAALSSLTRNLAVDIGDKVRINAIEPAAVATDMLLAGFEGKPEAFAELSQYHPVGRVAEPKEIAELAVFLCSEKSRFVQGACISATGGIHGCLSDPD
jgi:NAD(P)-dependent dehydrogenase (short-subunit alcohol dehydrogenase family)